MIGEDVNTAVCGGRGGVGVFEVFHRERMKRRGKKKTKRDRTGRGEGGGTTLAIEPL